MDLTYSTEDQAFRAHVRAWLAARLPVKCETLADRRAWHRQLLEAGFVGMGWPREYGGRGARPVQQAILSEEMTRAGAPPHASGPGMSLVAPTLFAHGSPAQKQRYLPKILSAEELWCELYSEPNAGSDLASLSTAAVRDDGVYVVNGQKIWTSAGFNADLGILLARTNPGVPKHQGISYFIVDMHTPGIEVRPLRQITGDAEFCEVFFTDVRIPTENMIGAEGEGWRGAQTTLSYERGGNTLSAATGRRQAVERLIRTCRGAGLLEDARVRNKLGRMLVDIEVMRAAGLRVLSSAEKGTRPGAESSVQKLASSEMEKRHQELYQEILGAFGQLLEDLPEPYAVQQTGSTISGEPVPDNWAFPYTWSRALTILAGTSEIQRNILGERVLGLPREPRADRGPLPGSL
ncbi:MAG: acyl-CoA dehydrogenase family protein [Chloroflexi bacterium]|nr:acyl-CoA dehydrogenase family protein [Chloroflexota bacterium]MBV9602840.1 acyl-CoA dehydrogenase family protein [Chloroflexota bacterium]